MVKYKLSSMGRELMSISIEEDINSANCYIVTFIDYRRDRPRTVRDILLLPGAKVTDEEMYHESKEILFGVFFGRSKIYERVSI